MLQYELGPFVKKVSVLTNDIAVEPPYHGKWRGSAKDFVIGGEVWLKELDEGKTEVTYTLEIIPKSILMRSVEGLVLEKIKKDVKEYARNILSYAKK